MLASVSIDIVIRLFVHCSTKSTYSKRLCFTTSEKCASVWSWQYVYFACDRTDFINLTAVNTNAIVQNRLTEQFVLNVIHQSTEKFCLNWVRKLFSIFCSQILLNLCNCLTTANFAVFEAGFFQKWSCFSLNSLSIFQSYIKRIQRKLFLTGLLYEFFLEQTHISNELLSAFQSSKHQFLRNFVSTTFYHCKAVFSSGNNDFKVALFNLFECRVDNVFTVQISNTAGSNRTVEWNIRNTSCSRSGNNSKNILSMNTIARNTGWNNLKFVTKRWLKKRAHRAVNKAANQNFLVLWPSLSLNKATRNLSGSIEFFVILNSYRHKILTFRYSRRSTNSCNNSGSAPLSVNTSISLFTDFSSFKDEIGISKFVGYSFYRHHFSPTHVTTSDACFFLYKKK